MDMNEEMDSGDCDKYWASILKEKTHLGHVRFPKMKVLFATLLCLPHSNADSERAFSHVRKINTEYRKSLGVDTLTNYLQVKLNCELKCYKVQPTKDMIQSAKSATYNYNKSHS